MRPTIMPLIVGLSALMALANGAPPKPPAAKDPQLRSELLRRASSDQEARKSLNELMKHRGDRGVVNAAVPSEEQQTALARATARVKEIDEENAVWLQGVVGRHGWPAISLVGADGAKAAWLLVQHADEAPQFQRRCLELMVELPKTEVSQADLAYLTDRVLLAEGKRQLYGTQFTVAEGKPQPRPLQDEAKVDERRAAVGLPPLAEYAKQIEELYLSRPSE